MALTTGNPYGQIQVQEDIYLESAPTIWFQDYAAPTFFAPDGDGFYWQLSGTSTYPVYEMGCASSVNMTENLTVNDVLCDNVGVKDTVQQRNYLEFQFSIKSFFPLTALTRVLKGGTVVDAGITEKFGMSSVDNSKYYHVYAAKVYDETAGDYFAIHLHKAKFVNPFTINMPFGAPWEATGLVFRAFADTTKPANQRFGVFVRADASVLS